MVGPRDQPVAVDRVRCVEQPVADAVRSDGAVGGRTAADQVVRAGTTGDDVGAVVALGVVVARAGVEDVVAALPEQLVVPPWPEITSSPAEVAGSMVGSAEVWTSKSRISRSGALRGSSVRHRPMRGSVGRTTRALSR